jgi:hypothetical protein
VDFRIIHLQASKKPLMGEIEFVANPLRVSTLYVLWPKDSLVRQDRLRSKYDIPIADVGQHLSLRWVHCRGLRGEASGHGTDIMTTSAFRSNQQFAQHGAKFKNICYKLSSLI